VLPSGEYLKVQQVTLAVQAGPSKGAKYTTTSARATIGTHRSADLVLTDDTMSRFHCELVFEKGQLLVVDLGSKNGTLVDGVPVRSAYLRDQSRLTLGHTELRVRFGDESARVPLSAQEHFGTLMGRSPAMRAVFSMLERAVQSQSTVLIEGETGTGKDLTAESLHSESARKDGPFVVVDCGAMATGLAESELFGHERGAFTGAERARAGAFEAASGGTLFLDEIGELSSELQPKLLRALESRTIARVGSAKPIPVDVRIVAATNRDLRAEVNARRFRSDLYFRLAVVTIRLPPLRERLDDLPLLVDGILERLTPDFRRAAAALRTEAFMQELKQREWTGNVRELRNFVEGCLVLNKPPDSRSAPAVLPATVDLRKPLATLQADLERAYLEAVLQAHNHQVSDAARAAGIARSQFYRLLSRYHLR
jgi:DNA-binding NtrC family response regulator